MSVNKKDLASVISKNAHITKSLSADFINTFIQLIKDNSKYKTIKFSSFGSFTRKKSPSRIGRNPKTKENFIITERIKLNFKCSNKLKNILN